MLRVKMRVREGGSIRVEAKDATKSAKSKAKSKKASKPKPVEGKENAN